MTKKIKDLTIEECRTICKKYYTKTYARCKECPLSHEPKICNGILMAFYQDHIQRIKNNEIKILTEDWEDYEEEKQKYITKYLEENLLDPNKEIEL